MAEIVGDDISASAVLKGFEAKYQFRKAPLDEPSHYARYDESEKVKRGNC